MNEKKEQTDWTGWLSTYGLLTAERILGRFRIFLPQDELLEVIKNKDSIYYQLLRAPLKHVFNGIILNQALDYQVYAQKLFVDYLMAGEDAKEMNPTRESLEEERLFLVEMGAEFRKAELEHGRLISETQVALSELSRDPELLLEIDTDNIRKIESILSVYIERAQEDSGTLRSFRKQFYELILRINELFRALSDYHPDLVKEAENRSVLKFDAQIGEKDTH